MAIEITIPRLGWSMEEGTFGEWLKQDGDAVSPGEPIFALESEKALQEVEAIDEGRLHIIASGPQGGDTVKVGALIGFLLAKDEVPPELREETGTDDLAVEQVTVAGTPTAGPAETRHTDQPQAAPRAKDAVAPPSVRRMARELGIDWRLIPSRGALSKNDVLQAAARSITGSPQATTLGDSIPSRSTRKNFPRITPRAARTARRMGVDWTLLTGSGRGGRIREDDVLAAGSLQGGNAAPAVVHNLVPGSLREISRVRRTIAQRMLTSVQQTAPVTLTTKVDAAALVVARQSPTNDASMGMPTFNDLLVKLVAGSLRECPLLNASWRDDGLFVYDAINLAIAVESEQGLLAPVLENAEQLSLAEISTRTRELFARARAGKLLASQLQTGTFTVTNLGMFDVDFFTPIINLPQTAILGIGRVVQEPVVRGGKVVAGWTLALSLTFDHRVVDGAPAARWLQLLSQRIAEPDAYL